MEPPIVNPPVPYIGYINNGFRSGRLVRVQGRINHNSHGFKIELLCGPNPNHDDVALHLNPRFSENVVIRNSRNYNSWGTEERQGSGFPFIRGQAFEVLILCEPEHFKIAINGQHYTEFNHRVPIERITHLTVDGDITIALVQFDGASSPMAPTAPQPLGGAAPYPPMGGYDQGYSGSAQPGFVPPPYPPNPGAGGIPAYPPQQAPYSTSAYGLPGSYAPPPGPYSQPQQGYTPSPYGGPAPGPYPPQHPPGGGYPAQPGYYQGDPQYPQQPGGYPGGSQSQGYPGKSSGGLMGNAGKLLAGVGLAGVASKIPGMMGGHGGHGGGHGGGYGGGHGGGHSSGGFPGGALGGAAALGLGGALAAKVLKPKKMKKMKMGKAMKYGVPLAGVGLGGYALHKGMHGFRRSSSSSSGSSGSSEEE